MAKTNLIVLQFKIFNLVNDETLSIVDGIRLIENIESFITKDTIFLEDAIEKMYKQVGNDEYFKSELKFITVTDSGKCLFSYTDDLYFEDERIGQIVDEIKVECDQKEE